MSKTYVNVRVGPRIELADADRASLDRIHSELRRQLADRGRDGEAELAIQAMTSERVAAAIPLTQQLTEGRRLSVAELATVCRALAWDVSAFYAAMRLDEGDYGGLIRLNDNVYFDLRAGDWDT